jgi:mono/diheme cytochrome c family protein
MPQAAEAGPSFVRQVGPILAQHCGRCHISSSSGSFNMSNFALLAKGTPAGRVIFPGDIVGSRLIEVIETGDMPRGNGKVPPEHLQTLKDWVLAGAKYDGSSPMYPLASMMPRIFIPEIFSASPANAAANTPTPAQPSDSAARPPSGNETVSFVKDVAPLLLSNCNGCHIDAMQTRGGLRMDNFAALLRGGDSGEIVSPGRAAASLLIRKLKGEEGARMPAGGRPPLSDEAIGLISKWIEEGAVFDGDAPDQPLRIAASLAWAKSASAEELSERRVQTARKNLQLITSATARPVEQSNELFFATGDVGEATAQAVLAAAVKASTRVKAFVDPSSIRGRVTIFVFPKRYDYSEFAKMVEQRSVPSEWQSHWTYDGADAYIAVLATSSDSDAAIEARLVAPLTSLAIAMRGADVPRWFAEGAGRAAAAKIAARQLPAVELWNQQLPTAVAAMKDGAQFVRGGLPPEQSDLIGYGIVSTMLGRNQRRYYDALLKEFSTSPSFDAAFTKTFGGPPATYVDRWKPQAMSGIDMRRR